MVDGTTAGTARATSLVDAKGHPVPEHLWPVFDSVRKRLQRAMKELASIRTNMAGLLADQVGTAFLAAEIIGDLARAHEAVRQAVPYCVCPRCNGDGCPTCKSTGFVPSTVWRRLPADQKKGGES
jgi:hypothetical protein